MRRRARLEEGLLPNVSFERVFPTGDTAWDAEVESIMEVAAGIFRETNQVSPWRLKWERHVPFAREGSCAHECSCSPLSCTTRAPDHAIRSGSVHGKRPRCIREYVLCAPPNASLWPDAAARALSTALTHALHHTPRDSPPPTHNHRPASSQARRARDVLARVPLQKPGDRKPTPQRPAAVSVQATGRPPTDAPPGRESTGSRGRSESSACISDSADRALAPGPRLVTFPRGRASWGPATSRGQGTDTEGSGGERRERGEVRTVSVVYGAGRGEREDGGEGPRVMTGLAGLGERRGGAGGVTGRAGEEGGGGKGQGVLPAGLLARSARRGKRSEVWVGAR